MEKISAFIKKCWDSTEQIERNTIDDWYEVSKETLPKDSVPQLKAWLLVYDEFLSWLISYNFLTQLTCLQGNGGTSLQKCRFSIGASVVSISLSLRKLAVDGHDIATRHVMRSLREYVDVLALLSIKPELCDEFINTQDEKDSNDFWHKYVSKGKAQKEIARNWKTRIEPNIVDEIHEWEKQESSSMAMASHPSYIAGMAIFFQRLGEEYFDEEAYNPLSILGVRTEMCVRPVRYGVITLCDHFLNCPFSELDKSLIDDDFLKPIFTHVEVGQKVLPLLAKYVLEHHDDDELGF